MLAVSFIAIGIAALALTGCSTSSAKPDTATPSATAEDIVTSVTPEPETTPEVEAAPYSPVFGDCLREFVSVPCTDAHTHEVYWVGEYPGEEFPAQLGAAQTALQGPALSEYLGGYTPVGDPRSWMSGCYDVNEVDWAAGIHSAWCLTTAKVDASGDATEWVQSQQGILAG